MLLSNSRQIDTNTLQYALTAEDGIVSFASWLHQLKTDPQFRSEFNALVAAISFPAFFWELPPVNNHTIENPFAFVAIKSDLLAGTPGDVTSFRDKINGHQSVVCFKNLGGDATLVVPCPEETKQYPHLATFCRTASQQQADLFWKTTAEAIETRLGLQPIWISTAGLGVPWLHLRIDIRPKYYRHAAFRQWPKS